MSVLDVWIGRLDDPNFHWKIRNEEFDGKQVDYGGFVARVTKQQIRDFTRECYADLFERFDNRAHTGKPYSESEIMDAIHIGILRAFDDWLWCLADGELHALVAAEL